MVPTSKRAMLRNHQPTETMTATELRNEISNCNEAIKAFKIGCPHLAPDGLSEAPSVKWLEMQKRLCVRQLTAIRNDQQ